MGIFPFYYVISRSMVDVNDTYDFSHVAGMNIHIYVLWRMYIKVKKILRKQEKSSAEVMVNKTS